MTAGKILSRVLQTIPVVLGVTLIVFSIMHLAPGDPIELMMGEAGHVGEGEIERLRHEYGLDLPLHLQYLRFLSGLARGDLGRSLASGEPVGRLIASRLPATIELTLVSILISLAIALPVGIVSAVRQSSLVDRIGTVWATLGVCAPEFWLGLVLMLVFSVNLHWFPISGRITYGVEPRAITGLYLLDSLLTVNLPAFVDALRHILMPAVTLGGAVLALTMRVIRASMLEVIHQDYVLFARSKGLSGTAVVLRHALRNALAPAVTVVALNVGILLGGNMIVETVFGWPGLGRLMVESIYNRDYPVVQAAVCIYALTYVAMNLVADVLYAYLNPRVKM